MIQPFKPASFKRWTQDKNYDAIVIGSGLGGMTTAVLLAKEGYKVLLLEQHYTAGGFTHTFKRGDWEWDVGLHYVGEVNRENSFMKLAFDLVTDKQLEWNEMSEVYDKIIINKRQFNIPKGVANFKKYLKSEFPGEEKAIDTYVELIFKAANSSVGYFADKVIPEWLSSIAGFFLRRNFFSFSDRTTKEVLDEITKNELLKAVLTAQYGDYGCPPSESSFAIHATVVKHYFGGGAYPVGGGMSIGNAMLPIVEKTGGKVLVSARVKKIIVENGIAKGVLMEDGREIFAKNIISNAGWQTTFKILVPNSAFDFPELKPSPSHICLYAGIDEDIDSYLDGNGNYWIYPGTNHDTSIKNFIKNPSTSEFPVVYISFPSSKDPQWKKTKPNKSTIEIISMMPYSIFAKWENERWKHRGLEYEAFKELLSQRLLSHLYEVLPSLKGKISYYELSTPLSTKHFANYQYGEIYGLDHTPARFRKKELRIRTPYKNFYLTGQDTVSVGIGGALVSGFLTAQVITGKNFMMQIGKEKRNRK